MSAIFKVNLITCALMLLIACGSETDNGPDTDGDGVKDKRDNCIHITNPDQLNTDGDSAGDACDAFPEDPNEIKDFDGDGRGDNADLDDDGDGVEDLVDVFPFDKNEWADADGDNIGDNKDLDLTEATGKNPKSIQMSRLLETGRAMEIHNLDGERFNGHITSLGDVNNDGFDDLGISDYNFSGFSGYLFIVFGQAGGWPRALDLNNPQSILDSEVEYIQVLPVENYLPEDGLFGVHLGANLAAVGDVNGDGIDDFAVSKYYDGKDKDDSLDLKNEYPGEVIIVFGREVGNWTDRTLTLDQLKASYGFSIVGEGFAFKLGESTLNAGDVNGDGENEIIVAETGWRLSPEAERTSKLHVLFGAQQLLQGQININDIPLLSTVAEDYSGLSRIEIYGDVNNRSLNRLASIGDLNNDGLQDFALSSQNGNDGLEVITIFGTRDWPDRLDVSSLNGVNGFKLIKMDSHSISDFGISSGDLDGDGLSDMVVSAFRLKEPVSFKPKPDPKVFIVFGKSSNWSTEIDVTELSEDFVSISDVNMEGGLGIDLAVIPDTNRDGIDELFISKEYNHGFWDDDVESLFHNPNGNVFKVLGRKTWAQESSIQDVTEWWFQGIRSDTPLGGQVDVSGDFNGDGIKDWIFVDQYPTGPIPEGYTSSSYMVFGFEQLYPVAE